MENIQSLLYPKAVFCAYLSITDLGMGLTKGFNAVMTSYHITFAYNIMVTASKEEQEYYEVLLDDILNFYENLDFPLQNYPEFPQKFKEIIAIGMDMDLNEKFKEYYPVINN